MPPTGTVVSGGFEVGGVGVGLGEGLELGGCWGWWVLWGF